MKIDVFFAKNALLSGNWEELGYLIINHYNLKNIDFIIKNQVAAQQVSAERAVLVLINEKTSYAFILGKDEPSGFGIRSSFTNWEWDEHIREGVNYLLIT